MLQARSWIHLNSDLNHKRFDTMELDEVYDKAKNLDPSENRSKLCDEKSSKKIYTTACSEDLFPIRMNV